MVYFGWLGLLNVPLGIESLKGKWMEMVLFLTLMINIPPFSEEACVPHRIVGYELWSRVCVSEEVWFATSTPGFLC